MQVAEEYCESIPLAPLRACTTHKRISKSAYAQCSLILGRIQLFGGCCSLMRKTLMPLHVLSLQR